MKDTFTNIAIEFTYIIHILSDIASDEESHITKRILL